MRRICAALVVIHLLYSFPDGGSITAVEPLTFTFGDSGLIDTGATSTPYILGSTFDLAAGDVLAFEAGGSFVLGAGGNLAYTSISIVAATGSLIIDSIGIITIADMSINVGTLSVITDASIEGSLTVSSDNSLSINGSGAITNTGTLSLTSSSVNLDTNLDLSNSASVSISGSITITASAVLTTGGGLIISNTTSNGIDFNVAATGEFNIGDLTPLDFSDPVLQGLELITADGGTCIVKDGKCIDSNGIQYKATEEGIVKIETGSDSGMLSFYSMFLVFFSLFAMRKIKLNIA